MNLTKGWHKALSIQTITGQTSYLWTSSPKARFFSGHDILKNLALYTSELHLEHSWSSVVGHLFPLFPPLQLPQLEFNQHNPYTEQHRPHTGAAMQMDSKASNLHLSPCSCGCNKSSCQQLQSIRGFLRNGMMLTRTFTIHKDVHKAILLLITKSLKSCSSSSYWLSLQWAFLVDTTRRINACSPQ